MSKPVAIITGAASGIGKETTKLFAEDHDLVLGDIATQQLEEFSRQLRQQGVTVYSVECDVSKPEHIHKLVDTARQKGAIKKVLHAAGVSQNQAAPRKIYDINLSGTAHLLNALTPHMRDGASAVCVASMLSHVPHCIAAHEVYPLLENPTSQTFHDELEKFSDTHDPYQKDNAYAFSKLGVRLLVQQYAHTWGINDARVTSISPGMIKTPMSAYEATQEGVKENMDNMVPATPLGRFGQPEEIANAVSFLCSGAASFISGVDLLVDGGLTHTVFKQSTQV